MNLTNFFKLKPDATADEVADTIGPLECHVDVNADGQPLGVTIIDMAQPTEPASELDAEGEPQPELDPPVRGRCSECGQHFPDGHLGTCSRSQMHSGGPPPPLPDEYLGPGSPEQIVAYRDQREAAPLVVAEVERWKSLARFYMDGSKWRRDYEELLARAERAEEALDALASAAEEAWPTMRVPELRSDCAHQGAKLRRAVEAVRPRPEGEG